MVRSMSRRLPSVHICRLCFCGTWTLERGERVIDEGWQHGPFECRQVSE